jgi:1-aminocyclopropane-1-carboxylate deaminase/D-cysteine desulfhydrase-like pyridoxal-dependent ACC family enzyme
MGIVHASSSGGTHWGLVLGNALHGSPSTIRGIVVAGEVYDDVPGQYLAFAQGGARLIGAEVELTRSDINLTADYLGNGYGCLLTGDGSDRSSMPGSDRLNQCCMK